MCEVSASLPLLGWIFVNPHCEYLTGPFYVLDELILRGRHAALDTVGRWVRGPGQWVGPRWVGGGPRWVIEVVSAAHIVSVISRGVGVLCAV